MASHAVCVCMYPCVKICFDIDGLVQGKRNSSALAMELRLSCTDPLIWCLQLNTSRETIFHCDITISLNVLYNKIHGSHWDCHCVYVWLFLQWSTHNWNASYILHHCKNGNEPHISQCSTIDIVKYCVRLFVEAHITVSQIKLSYALTYN